MRVRPAHPPACLPALQSMFMDMGFFSMDLDMGPFWLLLCAAGRTRGLPLICSTLELRHEGARHVRLCARWVVLLDLLFKF